MPKRYHCPVELAVDVIGGKWRPVILAHLKEGVHRYGQLRRRMPGVSEKMLTQRLRDLEADGLVARHDHEATPPHVEYRLTEEGLSLVPVLQALYDWGAGRAARTGTAIDEPALPDLPATGKLYSSGTTAPTGGVSERPANPRKRTSAHRLDPDDE